MLDLGRRIALPVLHDPSVRLFEPTLLRTIAASKDAIHCSKVDQFRVEFVILHILYNLCIHRTTSHGVEHGLITSM